MTSIRVALALAVLTGVFSIGCGGAADKPAPDASKVEPLPPSAVKSDAGTSDAAK
jgi:hypothetical protein